LGKVAESVEKGTRELRQLALVYWEPELRAKGEVRARKIMQTEMEKNALRIFSEADRLLQDARIDNENRTIRLEILIPTLQNSALVDDEFLAHKWAALLASATAGNPVHVSYPKILAELTPGEAKVLDSLYEWEKQARKGPEVSTSDRSIKIIMNETGLSSSEFEIAQENLFRHRLSKLDSFVIATEEVFDERAVLMLTTFGRDFVRACRGPEEASEK